MPPRISDHDRIKKPNLADALHYISRKQTKQNGFKRRGTHLGFLKIAIEFFRKTQRAQVRIPEWYLGAKSSLVWFDFEWHVRLPNRVGQPARRWGPGQDAPGQLHQAQAQLRTDREHRQDLQGQL